jgi:hypothetical protein
MDLIKKFMKIGGAQTPQQLIDMYPTEEDFFAAHPEARQYAMGGTPEAYPQIATFKNAFSYGVPPGPQYLAHGGSAFPQAQSEAQFFVPIYTDVYNPYNKAMGGSNVEMYPNANVPRVGPTNIYFQDGGQEGMTQEQPELDRVGAQNRTGAFATILKQTAGKANAKNAMMGAMNQVGMAKYGKQLDKFVPGGETNYTVSGSNQPYISQQMSPTSSQFNPTPYFGVDPPSYDHQLLDNMRARGIVYNPYQGQASYNPYQAQGYNPYATGDMSNFLPTVYDWNNQNQFMFQTKGSPRYKWKTNVPGEGKKRGVSNIDFLNAIVPELYGDPEAQMKALNDPKYASRFSNLNITDVIQEPTGMFGKRRKTTIKFGDRAGTTPNAGPSQTPMDLTRKNQPGPVATQSDDPIPFTLEDANTQLQQNNPRAKSIMDNLQNVFTPKPGQASTSANPSASPTVQSSGSPSQSAAASSSVNPDADYITNSKYPDLDQPLAGTNMTQRERLLQQLNSSDPKEVEYAKYRIGVMNDWDSMQGTTTTTSQAPSNANSSDAATAKKKAGQVDPSTYINQDYIDAQRAAAQQASYLTGPPERVPVGPVVGPEGFAYGGYTGYKFGGSYRQGDVVYMSDDEIAEFIRNGGQIEEME